MPYPHTCHYMLKHIYEYCTYQRETYCTYQVGSEKNLFLSGQVFPKYNEIIPLYEDIKSTVYW